MHLHIVVIVILPNGIHSASVVDISSHCLLCVLCVLTYVLIALLPACCAFQFVLDSVCLFRACAIRQSLS